MELFKHELEPKSFSNYFNYFDYNFDVKIQNTSDNKVAVKYFWKDQISGTLVFEEKWFSFENSLTDTKSWVLADAACDKLLGHIILDMKISKEQVPEMSYALQIHASRKIK